MLGVLRIIYRFLHYLLGMAFRIVFASFYIGSYYLVENPKAKLGLGVRHHPGTSQQSGLWCIFAINQRAHISQNLVSFTECLQRAGYNVILINNGRCSDELVAALLPYCHTIVLKPRGGRDFGGYKWGSGLLYDMANKKQAISQVIYCNDSIFVRPSALCCLLDNVKQLSEDYIGITESLDPYYHVQSWFFVVSGRLFHSNTFQNFWRKYKPLSYRLHSIKRGELGISSYFMRSGFDAHPLYTQAMIIDYVFDGSLTEAIERLFISFGPQEYNAIKDKVQQVTFSPMPQEQSARNFLKHYLMESLAGSNTINATNLILLERSTFPFLKKDLVYRGGYFFTQIDHTIGRWIGEDAEYVKEILAYFRSRGSLQRRHSVPAVLARIGIL